MKTQLTKHQIDTICEALHHEIQFFNSNGDRANVKALMDIEGVLTDRFLKKRKSTKK